MKDLELRGNQPRRRAPAVGKIEQLTETAGPEDPFMVLARETKLCIDGLRAGDAEIRALHAESLIEEKKQGRQERTEEIAAWLDEDGRHSLGLACREKFGSQP